MQSLLQQKCPSIAIQDLMLLLLAGAARKGNAGEVSSVREMCNRFCQCTGDMEEAAFLGAQLSVLSTCKRLEAAAGVGLKVPSLVDCHFTVVDSLASQKIVGTAW